MIVRRRAKEMRAERMRTETVSNTTQIMRGRIGTIASLVWMTERMIVIPREVVMMKRMICKGQMQNN